MSCHHYGTDDRNRRTTPCDCAILYCPKGFGCAQIRGLCTAIYRAFIHTAPAVGAFARLNFVDTVHNTQYTEVAGWFKSWEDIGLIGWQDKNNDGRIQYYPGAPFDGKPSF